MNQSYVTFRPAGQYHSDGGFHGPVEVFKVNSGVKPCIALGADMQKPFSFRSTCKS